MISFFSEDTPFHPKDIAPFSTWISEVIKQEECKEGTVNFIFCSKAFLLDLNKTYLGHNYHTDILTFDQSDQPDDLSGDIYISIDQVRENAEVYQQSFETELKRVMVHGVLHLVGYNDQTPDQQAEMRKKEEAYLSL